MRRNVVFPLVVGWIWIALVTSCSGGLSGAEVDATVQAAVDATAAAEEQMESAINEAVVATLTAMPTPTVVPLDQMSEEEVATSVEGAVEEAAQVSEQAAESVESAASDGVITEEELEELYYLYYLTLEEVEQTLDLIEDYYALYGELLLQTIESLEAIEDELEEISTTADLILAELDEINAVIQQGGQAAQEAVENLQTLAEDAREQAAVVRGQLPAWKQKREDEFGRLTTSALDVVPEQIADTRRGAITQARDYLDALQLAVGDGRFSLEELQRLSQLGANAAASLRQFSNGDLARLPDMIDGLTGNFARGQLPEIRNGLGNLRDAIPSIR